MHTLKDLIDVLRAASDTAGANDPLTIGGGNEYVVRTDCGRVAIEPIQAHPQDAASRPEATNAAKSTPAPETVEIARLERELDLLEKNAEEGENHRQELLNAAGALLDALDLVDFAEERDYIDTARKKLESLM
jgi:hypothetical protein